MTTTRRTFLQSLAAVLGAAPLLARKRATSHFCAKAGHAITGRIIYIDSVNGSDLTGIAGDATKPFCTPSAAFGVSKNGDLLLFRQTDALAA